jgi:hypothetical protein
MWPAELAVHLHLLSAAVVACAALGPPMFRTRTVQTLSNELNRVNCSHQSSQRCEGGHLVSVSCGTSVSTVQFVVCTSAATLRSQPSSSQRSSDDCDNPGGLTDHLPACPEQQRAQNRRPDPLNGGTCTPESTCASGSELSAVFRIQINGGCLLLEQKKGSTRVALRSRERAKRPKSEKRRILEDDG